MWMRLRMSNRERDKAMSSKRIDFYQLGNKLWSIANIFRDDTLKTTEYLEEFSYFLFLKLFDEQERQKEALDENYIPALPEELRFHYWAEKIITNEIDVTEAIKTVQDVFQKLAKIEDHDGKDLSLFRKLFKNHIWRIKYGPTIRELLKQLIDLELEQNFDVMGRAYEFVVQKLGEQKQYGQYFTPRHIIHFMVDLADPNIGEMIYDPAAGTGGFILRAFEIVKNKINQQAEKSFSGVKEPTASYGNVAYDRGEKLIRDLKEKHLWAVEKAPDVFKLAMMNMILHNDGKSNLYEADSLDNRAQSEHREKYDVVLSNPPYGPLTQSRTATFIYHVKRFEALFFQHIMNALKFSESKVKRSRAVVIILDKILFDNTNAFKNIRKKLLREYNLKAVFSMPAGIFQPYSGVKTTVMYFERPTKDEWKKIKNANSFATQKVMFFDVQSDGFTLSTQRRPINGAFQGDNPNIYEPPCGDLPKAVETFKKWDKWLQNPTDDLPDFVDNKQVWIADIEEIKEKDFNLNPGLYRNVTRGKVKWEWVRLGEICEIRKGTSITKARITPGDIPVIAGGQQPAYYHNEANRDGNIITVSASGAYAGFVQYFKTPVFASDCSTIKSFDESVVLTEFIFYVLKGKQDDIYKLQRGAGQPHVYPKDLSNIKIPLPPLEIQQQIVERLNKQQAIIEKMKEAEKAILDASIDDAIFEGDWEWVELVELLNDLYRYPTFYNIAFKDKGIPVLKIENISNEGFIVEPVTSFIDEETNYKFPRTVLKENDCIMAVRGATIGKVALIPKKFEGANINANLIKISLKQNRIIPKYFWFFINSNLGKNQFNSVVTNSAKQTVTTLGIKSLKIPLPPLEKQQEIVAFLDTQFKTLEHIRKLKENAQETIKIILEKEVFTDG